MDVDRDGVCDVLTGTRSAAGLHQVACLRGDGTGGFAALLASAGSGDVFGLVAADSNGDGIPNVLVANGPDGTGRIDSFLGNGTGSFHLAQSLLLVDDVKSIATADWNLDGVVDAAGGFFFGGIGLARGTGTGTYLPAGTIAGASAYESLVFADMDGDGRPDLVFVGPAKVGILRNRGGAFAASSSVPAVQAWEVSVGDLDLDGSLDVFMGGGPPTVAIPGDGAARLLAPGFGNQGLALCDLDSNGRGDLVAVTGSSEKVVVYPNGMGWVPGALLFGAGIAGCVGTHGLATSGPPVVGNVAFGLTVTSTPLTALGLVLVADVDDPAGSDLSLAGTTHVVQAISLWPTGGVCRPSAIGLSSSRGLRLRIP